MRASESKAQQAHEARWRRWSLARRLVMVFGEETTLRRRVINIGHLLSGNAVSGLIALVGVAIVARALGPTSYGVLALVISYGRTIERISRFESWQPLIKYAAAIEGDTGRLRLLYAFGLRLDVAACLLAAATAAGFATLAGPWIGLAPSQISLVHIYCLALAFNVNGMPTSVLRLGGRYRTIAYVQVVSNLIRVLWCAVGLWRGASLEFYVWAWTISQVLGSLAFLALAWAEMRRQGVRDVATAPIFGLTRDFPGIMGFAWSANLSMTLRSSAHDLDVLVVGWLASPAAAGLYYIAKRFAILVQQINAQVQAVLYPDIARMWVAGQVRSFVRAMRQIQLLMAGFCALAFLAVLILGHWLIVTGLGVQYASAWPLLLVQIVAVWLTAHSAPSRTAMLAMGLQQSVLRIALVATIAFHASMFLLVPILGPMGANIAHVVLALICAIWMDHEVRRGTGARLAEARGLGCPAQ
ncbi:MAG: lipopolysaccharide biosynthesis protein [Rhizobiaceae bacterium]|nr:MAG: lipopolysaccharide biosynthesis protein [Rhizobiaceae bacterium]